MAEASSILSNIRNHLSTDYTVPAHVVDSGFQIVGDRSVQNQMLDHYLNDRNLLRLIADYRSAMVSVVTHFVDIKGTSVIKFEDGSQAYFKVTIVVSTESWVESIDFELVKVVDESGNEIQENNSRAVIPTGTYTFDPDAPGLEAFIDAARRAGIPITRGDFLCGGVCIVTITDLMQI